MKAGEYIREELTPDGLHPNDKGHKLVAEEIEKFLESVKAELEVEEKEPVFPKAMTENAYENAKRLTIREISPKLCHFLMMLKYSQAYFVAELIFIIYHMISKYRMLLHNSEFLICKFTRFVKNL